MQGLDLYKDSFFFFFFYHVGNMLSDEKSFAQHHLVAFVAGQWINAWLDQSFSCGFGRGQETQMLLWEGGGYLEEGGRLKREDKPCCFYSFPHEVAFSVPFLLSASFLPLNGEHSIPPPYVASPRPHRTEVRVTAELPRTVGAGSGQLLLFIRAMVNTHHPSKGWNK